MKANDREQRLASGALQEAKQGELASSEDPSDVEGLVTHLAKH